MKAFLTTIAVIAVAAGMAAPAARAQAVARPRTAQIFAEQETPYLGISCQEITPDRAKALKLKEERGAEVTVVYPDTAAAKAGLKEGDVILEYNGQHVEGWEQLKRLVSETPIHREVKIGVWRNGAAQTLTATVGSHKETMVSGGFGGTMDFPDLMKLPPAAPMPPSAPMVEIPSFRSFQMNMTLGVNFEQLSQEPQLAEYFGVKEGALVRSVVKNSAGERAGLKAGDVITKIDDTEIAGQRDITMALRSARTKKTCTLTVVRKGKEMSLTLSLENSPTFHGSLWGPQADWYVLQLFSNDGVVQGSEKGFPKILWQ